MSDTTQFWRICKGLQFLHFDWKFLPRGEETKSWRSERYPGILFEERNCGSAVSGKFRANPRQSSTSTPSEGFYDGPIHGRDQIYDTVTDNHVRNQNVMNGSLAVQNSLGPIRFRHNRARRGPFVSPNIRLRSTAFSFCAVASSDVRCSAFTAGEICGSG